MKAAIIANREDMVRDLLSHGAIIELKNEVGTHSRLFMCDGLDRFLLQKLAPLLIEALENKNGDMFARLLDAGADPNVSKVRLSSMSHRPACSAGYS